MKLTKNFSLDEFIYSDFFGEFQEDVLMSCQENESLLLPNIQKLAIQLQVLRDYINKPISINIAYRPVWWEHKQKRSGGSQHCLGNAADIVSKDYTPRELAQIIEHLISDSEMLQGGLSAYSTFTHYDIGYNGRKRRW